MILGLLIEARLLARLFISQILLHLCLSHSNNLIEHLINLIKRKLEIKRRKIMGFKKN